MRKSKIIRNVMFVGCMVLMMSFANACSKCKSEPTTNTEKTFSENLEAELGKEYDPEIYVSSGSTLYSVKLYDENGNEVELKDGYKFVPEYIGQYYYKVEIETDGVIEQKTYTINVLDVAAPTIVTPLETAVSAEVGVYSGFASDVEKIAITDDNTAMLSYVTKKAVAITFNGKTEENAAGYEQYFFKEVGEYTVKVAIADISGNTAYTEYKINTVDTTAPIVEALPLQYIWLDGQGNVLLPQPSMHDVSTTQVSVSAKLGNTPLTITDGKVAASVGDTITVSYTVKDAYDNESTVESQVKVLEKGQLIDKADEAVSELFTAKEGVVEYDNGVSFVSEKTSDTLEWLDGAYAFGTATEFSGVAFTIKNLGTADVEMHIAAKRNGKKIYVGSVDLLPTGEETTCTFDLSKYALGEVDGWAFEMKSFAALNLTLTESYLMQFSDDGLTTPGNAQSETETEKKAYAFANVYNGGFAKNSDVKYVKNGAYSAKATVKASGNVGVTFQNAPFTLTNENYLSFSVYTSTAGSIKMGVVLGEKYTEYRSGEIELARGWNTVGFVIDKINSDFNGKAVNGIFCYNAEKYDNIFYIDNLVFSRKTSLTDAEMFAAVSGYQADTAKLFTIPNALCCDRKLTDEVSVAIKTQTGTELIQATLGEKVSLAELAGGEYQIVYTATDVFGATHEKAVKLTVKSDLLSGKIGLKTYRVNEAIELPEPTLSSGTYTQNELKNAAVRKYYRAEGGLEWIPVTKNLQFTETGYYDVKYTITLDDMKIAITEKTYIHEQGVYFDFEAYENGANMGGGVSSGRGTWISDEWSRSGKYSLYVYAGTQGTSWSGVDFPKGEFKFETPVDTIVFWAYSEIDRTTGHVGIGYYPSETATGMYWDEVDVKIKAGVHRYVVKLNGERNNIGRLYFEVSAFENMYIDDVSFAHSPTAEFPDVDEKEFLSSAPISLTKPKLLNVDPIAFTESDIAAALYTVKVKDENGETTTYNFTDDVLALNLQRGKYTLTFTVMFGAFNYVSEQVVIVHDLYLNFNPDVVYEKGVAYELQLPEVSEEGVNLSVYCRKQGETDWTELVIEGDKAKLTLEAVGNYEIRLLAEKGELFEEAIYKALVRAENTILDLELNADGTHYGAEKYIYGGKISTEWSYDGKYSFFVTTQGWTFFRFGNIDPQDPDRIELGGTYNTITMWIYSDHEISDFALEPWVGRGAWLKSAPTTIQEGVHQYVFTFNESFDSLRAVGFEIKYDKWTDFYIDCVQVYNVTVEPPKNVPKEVKVGETLKINASDIKVESAGLAANTVVKYKKVGETDYTKVALANGEYAIKFETDGSYEIVIEVTVAGKSYTYEYLVAVLGQNTDPWINDTTWN